MQQKNFLEENKLEIVVFLGGMIGMILELVGSRVISPYFGNSLIVWTSLIGVILGSLSLGYYLGGRLSDKESSYEFLGTLFLLGAIFLGITATFKDIVLGLIKYSSAFTLQSSSFIAVTILFAPVSIVLGMISPFAAKIRLNNQDPEKSGKVIGNLYALSTFGSISGTFMAGFYLIPLLGNRNLLYLLAFGLLISSVLTVLKFRKIHVLTGFFILVFYLWTGTGIFSLASVEDIDSLYNRIIIGEHKYEGKKLITMSIDNEGIQSAIFPDAPNDLVLDYEKSFLVSEDINNDTKKALMIGGGGYSYPRYYLATHPSATMDVVEIDPEITAMAKKYFLLNDDPRMKIYHKDARNFLNESTQIYDVIFLDAFNSITPPFHLTTLEFMQDIKKHLDPNGVLIINLISAIQGENSTFLKLETNTLSNVFTNVRAFKITNLSENNIQNILLTISQNNIHIKENKYSEIKLDFGNKILTDNWAPIEYLTRNYY